MSMNPAPFDALFLADNLALDFINSAYGVGEQTHDCLMDDSSVVSWLEAAGVLPEGAGQGRPSGLLAAARELREHLQVVLTVTMEGGVPDLTAINRLLEAGRPVRSLEWDDEGPGLRIALHPKDRSPETLLWPLADAFARLVTDEKFQFVRQCEAHDCILFFHDLSKSHRRRWCSMATCGNRMKAASFRLRKKGE